MSEGKQQQRERLAADRERRAEARKDAEPLARESRYEGCWRIEPVTGTGDVASPAHHVTRCLSCGSLVMMGREDDHERLHPRVGCQRLGCGVYHRNGHAWEEQFPAPSAPGGGD